MTPVFILSMVFIALAIFVVYANFKLLKREKSKRLVNFNKWLNFFQIIQLSIYGFTIYFVMGLEFMPYFSYKEQMKILWEISSFNIRSSIAFTSGIDAIEVGVNIVPLILFILWDYVSRKLFVSSEKKMEDLDLSK